ncbi:cysteine--tRNA ligase, partial [Flavobacteriaceae bacterium]|nr:cysteine--tRNA ligase [Flavobacteriaceae bacterium]
FKIFLFDVLGLVDKPESNNAEDKISSELIGLLIKLRNQSRENKDFKLSDQIRDDLMNLGIQLNDDKKESYYKKIK